MSTEKKSANFASRKQSALGTSQSNGKMQASPNMDEPEGTPVANLIKNERFYPVEEEEFGPSDSE